MQEKRNRQSLPNKEGAVGKRRNAQKIWNWKEFAVMAESHERGKRSR